MNTSLWFYIYILQGVCQYPKYFYCYISNGFFLGYILKGHIKIDSRNRLNWSPRLNVWFKELSTTNFMFMYEKLYNLIWKCHEVFFYTILNVFPKREKLKYLKYIRLRLQDHHRSFEHASVYRINVYKMYFSL